MQRTSLNNMIAVNILLKFGNHASEKFPNI